MANTAHNILVAQRRYQILQILNRIRSWCSIEYIHGMLNAERWCLGGAKSKKDVFRCKLSAVQLDLREMKAKRLVQSVSVRHFDQLRPEGPGQHYKISVFTLTDKGKRELR
jgi:hypothetical protein